MPSPEKFVAADSEVSSFQASEMVWVAKGGEAQLSPSRDVA